MVKSPPANARDSSSIPGLGRSPEEGNDNPLQYSCLGNPMDRGAWWTMVHGAVKSSARLSTQIRHTLWVLCGVSSVIFFCIMSLFHSFGFQSLMSWIECSINASLKLMMGEMGYKHDGLVDV